ncbi:MAG: hypothetical protein HKP55_07470 [Gammaproteobacteria bacterium]|nr:hypothetical protein [Gammaproteobacteria bacterium]
MYEKYFKKVTSIVFGIILAFLTIGIAIGALKLVINFIDIIQTAEITGSYQKMISDVLSLFILIELSRSLVSYFESDTLKVMFILDAGLVFVLREIMIMLFENKATETMLLSITALLLVIGGLRIAWMIADKKVNLENPDSNG